MTNVQDGGWSAFHEPDTQEKEIFSEAFKNFTGVHYTPLKVQSQVVAGINYRYLCQANSVEQPGRHHLAFVEIYVPLHGRPEIKNIENVSTPDTAVDQVVRLAELRNATIVKKSDNFVLEGVIEPFAYFLYSFKLIPKNNPSYSQPETDYWPYYLLLEETGICINPGLGPVAQPTPFSHFLAHSQIGRKGIKVIAHNLTLELDIVDATEAATKSLVLTQGHPDDFTLLSLTARLKNGIAESEEGVLGFEHLVRKDNQCYQFYQAEKGYGTTAAQPVYCPLGLADIGHYKIDYAQAIGIFHTGNWGGRFVELRLSKPLTPQVKEPIWTFISDLGVQVQIGADSGKVLETASGTTSA